MILKFLYVASKIFIKITMRPDLGFTSVTLCLKEYQAYIKTICGQIYQKRFSG